MSERFRFHPEARGDFREICTARGGSCFTASLSQSFIWMILKF